MKHFVVALLVGLSLSYGRSSAGADLDQIVETGNEVEDSEPPPRDQTPKLCAREVAAAFKKDDHHNPDGQIPLDAILVKYGYPRHVLVYAYEDLTQAKDLAKKLAQVRHKAVPPANSMHDR